MSFEVAKKKNKMLTKNFWQIAQAFWKELKAKKKIVKISTQIQWQI